jgi:uroporphyrinogen III methyltransferase / synthase
LKNIVITRPRLQADEMAGALITAGFEPIFFPVIAIQPVDDTFALDHALKNLSCYDWLIFTSVNGVITVWERMVSLGINELPALLHVAAIGPKTAQALQLHGIKADYIPAEYVAEAILPGLGNIRSKWILLPRAEIARQALPDAIAQAGGIAHEIAVYQTLPVEPDPFGLDRLQAGVDVITLTSPSIVHNFVDIVRSAGMDPCRLPGCPAFACIGPITGQAAVSEGLAPLILADEYTSAGLVRAIQKFVKVEENQ